MACSVLPRSLTFSALTHRVNLFGFAFDIRASNLRGFSQLKRWIMRHYEFAFLFVTGSFLMGMTSCAADSMKPPSETQPTPSVAQAREEKDQLPSGEVQERAAPRIAPGVVVPRLPSGGIALPPPVLPGEFAIRTQKGYYLTAVDGGGRTTDPVVITVATSAGPWEKFKLIVTSPSSPQDKSLQTARGNFVTAVSGGGLTANVLHTDATQARDWERFGLLDLSVGNFAPSYYALNTIKGLYVTAVGAGGKYADAIHTDATQVQAWEQFRIVKCGDVGSGYEYGVMAADGSFLSAGFGPPGDIELGTGGVGPQTRFTLIQQGDGSYALRTSNGVTYVTALGGGGKVQEYVECHASFPGACLSGFSSIFHTDATQVQAWEKFRLMDQGNCTYAIQTVSGYYMGIYTESHGYHLLTTDRSTISDNERFQLVVYGLASPVFIP